MYHNLNKPLLEKLNVFQWWDKGFDGKGIKIASFEAGVSEHSWNSIDVCGQVAKGAEVFDRPTPIVHVDNDGKLTTESYNELNQFFHSIVDEGVKVCTYSIHGFYNEQLNTLVNNILVKNGVTLCASAGNNFLGGWGLLDNSISTGALRLNNGIVERVPKTQIGEVSILTNFYALRTNYIYELTSGASPVLASMVAIYYQAFNDTFGRYPTFEEVRKFLHQNKGELDLITLPDVNKFIEGKVDEIKIIKSDVAPFIKDDRTFLPIRVIAEALGATVDWNGTTRQFTLTIGSRKVTGMIGSHDLTVEDI